MVLNNIFKAELEDNVVGEYLDFTRKLIPFLDCIIKSDISLPSSDYSVVNDRPFDYADVYIKRKHSQYYSELRRMWEDNEICVNNFGCVNAACDSYTGKIYISQSNTLLDDLFLVHEFFHHQNLIPENQNSIYEQTLSRELFGESISIMAQLDFLKNIENCNLKKDGKIFECDYVNDCLICAKKVRVELILIDIFNTYGDVSDDSVEKYLSACNDEYLKELVAIEYESCLEDISGWGANLKFLFNLKYVLGITVGYYLADLVEKDSSRWGDIYYINSNFYNIDINSFFDRIGTTLENNDILLNFFEHCSFLCNNFCSGGEKDYIKEFTKKHKVVEQVRS